MGTVTAINKKDGINSLNNAWKAYFLDFASDLEKEIIIRVGCERLGKKKKTYKFWKYMKRIKYINVRMSILVQRERMFGICV